MKTITLNNQIKIPEIGLGVFLLTPTQAYNSTLYALKNGCRLIDTANIYQNERAVGKAIKDSGIKREEIFISTKIWTSEYTNPNCINETLQRLGVDYIDLLFLHQPCTDKKTYINAYKMLEQAYKEGKIKSIGLSNCEGKYINQILDNCIIKPQVVQVECHPYFTQKELIKNSLESNNIKLMSWYPLGHADSKLLNEKILKNLANKYNKTTAQIIIRWHIQKGFIVIPGSKNLEHIKENLDIYDFELSNKDMELISSIDINKRYYIRTDESLNKFKDLKPEYEKE